MWPLGVRRNTFSGDGNNERPEAGQRHDSRGMDGAESLRRAIGENTRDADDAARQTVPTELYKPIMVYTEPLYLSLPNEPSGGIICLRAVKVGAEQFPTGAGGFCDFVWDGVQSRAVITSIDGLTPDGSSYKFKFWVIG